MTDGTIKPDRAANLTSRGQLVDAAAGGTSLGMLDQKAEGKRRLRMVFSLSRANIREQADMWLFFIGICVEYALLGVLLLQYAVRAPSTVSRVMAVFVLACLMYALYVHQFLIFRNSFLQYSRDGGGLRKLELAICLIFGVLTGEMGYLVVLFVCNVPRWLTNGAWGADWLAAIVAAAALTAAGVLMARRRVRGFSWRQPSTWFSIAIFISVAGLSMVGFTCIRDVLAIRTSPDGLDWFFAPRPLRFTETGGTLAVTAIEWFANSLGRVLECLFALGALALSVMILWWDMVTSPVDHRTGFGAGDATDAQIRADSYVGVMKFFKGMDALAAVTWLAVLGVILPSGFAQPIRATAATLAVPLIDQPSQGWFFVLSVLGLLYGLVARWRLVVGRRILGLLSSDEIARGTVI